MTGKPDPKPTVRETARRVDRILAHLETRERNLKRAITIVRTLKSIPKKQLPDVVKRR